MGAGVCVTALFFGSSWMLAWKTGASAQFLTDPRWYLSAFAFGAFALLLAYLPGALDRLWRSLRPWLATPEKEAAAFWARSPETLMRFFWPAWGFWLLVIAPGPFNPGSDPWLRDYPNPEAFRPFMIAVSIFGTYLLAATTSVAVAGLASFLQDMARDLDLKRGFILGGKGAFAPFTRLMQVIWLTYTIPVALVIASNLAVSGPQAALLSPRQIMSATVGVVLLALTMFLPHFYINGLLAKEKDEELRHLQAGIDQNPSVPKKADPRESLRRKVRAQVLVDQLLQARAFTPTLMDARFFIQAGASVTGIILANILIRKLL